MKKTITLALFFTFLLLGVGCKQKNNKNSSNSETNVESQSHVVSESGKQEKNNPNSNEEKIKNETTLYSGSWFDVEFPKDFIPNPLEPEHKNENVDKTFIKTDEAFFASPDGTVEFFIYSPQWSGTPKAYFNVVSSEELVDEKVKTIKKNNMAGVSEDWIERYTTIKAKDNSYFRSYVSMSKDANSKSVGYAFGIKYKDHATYEKHKKRYIAFKKSLRQYAD